MVQRMMCHSFGRVLFIFAQHMDKFYSILIDFRMPTQGGSKQNWTNAIKNYTSGLLNILSRVDVCALHFRDEDFINSGKLDKRAVPSIFRYFFCNLKPVKSVK